MGKFTGTASFLGSKYSITIKVKVRKKYSLICGILLIKNNYSKYGNMFIASTSVILVREQRIYFAQELLEGKSKGGKEVKKAKDN